MKYEVLGTDSHSYSIKMPTSRAGASRSASISDKMKAQMDERAEVLKARLQEKKRSGKAGGSSGSASATVPVVRPTGQKHDERQSGRHWQGESLRGKRRTESIEAEGAAAAGAGAEIEAGNARRSRGETRTAGGWRWSGRASLGRGGGSWREERRAARGRDLVAT